MISAKVFVVLLGLASLGLCDSSRRNRCISRAANRATVVTPLTLFDFTADDANVSSWEERSDTSIIRGGRSEAGFVLGENGEGLKRAVFFALLNPRSNGFASAGYRIQKSFDLSAYTKLRLRARAQGKLTQYRIVLRQDGQNNNPALSYQQTFEVPCDYKIVTLPLSGFAAYNLTTRVEGVVVNPATITSFGIAALTAANEAVQQTGTGALEIDWIRADL